MFPRKKERGFFISQWVGSQGKTEEDRKKTVVLDKYKGFQQIFPSNNVDWMMATSCNVCESLPCWSCLLLRRLLSRKQGYAALHARQRPAPETKRRGKTTVRLGQDPGETWKDRKTISPCPPDQEEIPRHKSHKPHLLPFIQHIIDAVNGFQRDASLVQQTQVGPDIHKGSIADHEANQALILPGLHVTRWNLRSFRYPMMLQLV